MPRKLALTFSLPLLLTVARELYLQFAFRRAVLEDTVLAPFLNTILTLPVQSRERGSLVQYLASRTPGGQMIGTQLRPRTLGAQSVAGSLIDPVVLNLYGLFLSRLGETFDDVEVLVVPVWPTASEVTRNIAVNDSTASMSKRFTADASDARVGRSDPLYEARGRLLTRPHHAQGLPRSPT